MTDDIALILIKRIEALEEQVAEMKAARPEPLTWPAIDLGSLDEMLYKRGAHS